MGRSFAKNLRARIEADETFQFAAALAKLLFFDSFSFGQNSRVFPAAGMTPLLWHQQRNYPLQAKTNRRP